MTTPNTTIDRTEYSRVSGTGHLGTGRGPVSPPDVKQTSRESMRTQFIPFQRKCRGLPFLRLAQELGYAKEKTARDQLARPYLQVAKTNLVLLQAGCTEKIAELMAVVDASLTGELPTTLDDALHEAEIADCLEQVADESFRDKRRRGAATVKDAREYLRRSAIQRQKAEIAERETLRWIVRQEPGK